MESSRPGRKRFAKMLKFLRELNNAMAQNELPQESSVAIELIQNYEQEKIPAKDKDKERLAEALGTHPTAFLAIKPEEPCLQRGKRRGERGGPAAVPDCGLLRPAARLR